MSPDATRRLEGLPEPIEERLTTLRESTFRESKLTAGEIKDLAVQLLADLDEAKRDGTEGAP